MSFFFGGKKFLLQLSTIFIPPVNYKGSWADGNRETKFERDGISNVIEMNEFKRERGKTRLMEHHYNLYYYSF